MKKAAAAEMLDRRRTQTPKSFKLLTTCPLFQIADGRLLNQLPI
jgi:hypothetical protein